MEFWPPTEGRSPFQAHYSLTKRPCVVFGLAGPTAVTGPCVRQLGLTTGPRTVGSRVLAEGRSQHPVSVVVDPRRRQVDAQLPKHLLGLVFGDVRHEERQQVLLVWLAEHHAIQD